MQNVSDILSLFCTPTWPSQHVSENQEYFRRQSIWKLGITFLTIIPFVLATEGAFWKKGIFNPMTLEIRMYELFIKLKRAKTNIPHTPFHTSPKRPLRS